MPGVTGQDHRNVVVDGRVIGNVQRCGTGWDGETEHGAYLLTEGSRPFVTAELAEAAVRKVWADAEAGPTDDD